jgi:hypothetical protein
MELVPPFGKTNYFYKHYGNSNVFTMKYLLLTHDDVTKIKANTHTKTVLKAFPEHTETHIKTINKLYSAVNALK